MPFKPPLTRQQLQDIQERNPNSADVRALLWEVKRLRAIALRTDQLLKDMPTVAGTSGLVADMLRRELADEPVILEQQIPES